jgi:16S rRNA G1207 methylase RsmC
MEHYYTPKPSSAYIELTYSIQLPSIHPGIMPLVRTVSVPAKQSVKSAKTYTQKPISHSTQPQTLLLYSCSGLFSATHLDKGAQLLLSKSPASAHIQTVLDLGCANGVVGLSYALLHKPRSVFFVDINQRAIDVTNKNIVQLQKQWCELPSFTTLCSDGFSQVPVRTFDLILFNPPQSAGRDLCLTLIKQAKSFLSQTGSIVIVARPNVGGSYFEQFMKQEYGNCSRLARGKGFCLYESQASRI